MAISEGSMAGNMWQISDELWGNGSVAPGTQNPPSAGYVSQAG